MHLKIRAIENNDHLLRQVSDVALINLLFSVPVGCRLSPQCLKSLFYFLKFILPYSIPHTEHLLEKTLNNRAYICLFFCLSVGLKHSEVGWSFVPGEAPSQTSHVGCCF